MSGPPPRRPRVAFVYHFMPDYREGVFRALLDDPAIEAEFVAGPDAGVGAGFDGVPTTDRIPYREVRNLWLGPLLWQRGVVGLAWRRGHDALVFRGSWLTLSTWVGAAIARLRGKRVFFWMIGWRRRERGFRRPLRPLYLRLAHVVLLYGERARRLGIEHGYPAERLRVIGNSLPVEAVDASAIVEPEGSLSVLWMTRLLPYKKPRLLVDAIRIAHERGVRLDCTFVGAGDTDELVAHVAALGLEDHVRFVGRRSDEEASALLAGARVVAVPGHAGLTVAHAIVHGVPVVVNDDPDANPPEWEYVMPVDGDAAAWPGGIGFNGSRFRRDDAASLCDELVRWCVERPASTEERRRIAREGAELVSPERSAAAIVAAILDQGTSTGAVGAEARARSR